MLCPSFVEILHTLLYKYFLPPLANISAHLPIVRALIESDGSRDDELCKTTTIGDIEVELAMMVDSARYSVLCAALRFQPAIEGTLPPSRRMPPRCAVLSSPRPSLPSSTWARVPGRAMFTRGRLEPLDLRGSRKEGNPRRCGVFSCENPGGARGLGFCRALIRRCHHLSTHDLRTKPECYH